MVMQSTQHWLAAHPKAGWSLPNVHRRQHGRDLLRQTLVGTLAVEILDILADHPVEMARPEQDHVIQALAADRAEEPFAIGIGTRGVKGRLEDRNPGSFGDCGKVHPKLDVVVADQIPGRKSEGRRLAQLLRQPGIGRLARDGGMDNPARSELDDEKREQVAEPDVGQLQEVTRPDGRSLIVDERRPGLLTRPGTGDLALVFLDGALTHADGQLQQFAADPLGAP